MHITVLRLLKAVCLFAVLAAALPMWAQSELALKYAKQVEPSTLRTMVEIMASDEFEGRGTGVKGSELAANYIVDYYNRNKVRAGNGRSYLQDIEARVVRQNSKYCWIRKEKAEQEFDYRQHFSYYNQLLQDSVLKTDRIVVVGENVCKSECASLNGIDLDGMGVMIVAPASTAKPELGCLDAKRPKFIMTVRPHPDGGFSSGNNNILFHDENSLPKTPAPIPIVEMDELLANKILEPANTDIAQLSAKLQEDNCATLRVKNRVAFRGNHRIVPMKAANILAFIEGGDLKDEYVVLCAHYDHIGRDKDNIFNGADDNASGTVAAMEIARLLSKAKNEGKTLRRSVVVLLVTGEELGLKGSAYYTQNPIYPLDKTVACINLDMIGRIADQQQKVDNKYVMLSYHETETGKLDSCIKQINRNSTGLRVIDHVYPQSYEFFKYSDQYSFYLKDVPAILLTSGLHPDYHTANDIPKKIDYFGMAERTRLALLAVWSCADDFNIK